MIGPRKTPSTGRLLLIRAIYSAQQHLFSRAKTFKTLKAVKILKIVHNPFKLQT